MITIGTVVGILVQKATTCILPVGTAPNAAGAIVTWLVTLHSSEQVNV